MAPVEDGLVDELIRQFTDPLAFYRELVQNSIDAGASRIVVHIDWDERDREQAVRVRDDGSGMSREVLESELTVLFRSSKEARDDAIGKFGVGFVSVLALEPELVEVRSSEGAGITHTLQLHPDQTYEVFEARGGDSRGTTVTLHTRCESDEDHADFVERSRAALVRWCRFAQVPLVLTARVRGTEVQHRIDRPLGFEGSLVEVVAERGPTRVAAALMPEPSAYLAFFNRGLLLREDSSEALGMVHTAIVDPRLGHTLSRDDVRQDEAYHGALRAAADVVRRDLLAAIKDAFDRASRGEGPALDQLLRAVRLANLPIDSLGPRFPLAHAIAGATSLSLRELRRERVYADARGPSPESELAAASSIPVLDLSIAAGPEGYRVELAALREGSVPTMDEALVFARPVEETPSDLLLCERCEDLLAELLRRPRVRLMTLDGAPDVLFSSGRSDGRAPCALEPDERERDPFARWRRPPLWLSVRHPLVEAARAKALDSPSLAAAILARGILLAAGVLELDMDERWLEAAMGSLDG